MWGSLTLEPHREAWVPPVHPVWPGEQAQKELASRDTWVQKDLPGNPKGALGPLTDGQFYEGRGFPLSHWLCPMLGIVPGTQSGGASWPWDPGPHTGPQVTSSHAGTVLKLFILNEGHCI